MNAHHDQNWGTVHKAVKLMEISLNVDGEAAEAVSAVFNQYGQGGAIIEELYPEDLFSPSVVRAKTFLSVEHSAVLSQIEQALWHLGQIYPIPSPTVRWLSEADWTEAWKAGYKAQRIGRRILIRPSWQTSKVDSLSSVAERVVIELDPGLAFGTGMHPSTRLCLRALENHLQRGQRVLDVGTGSGILAIAAAKLGAESIVAIDIDDLALQVAQENMARNGVQASILLVKASLAPVTTPDWPVPNRTIEEAQDATIRPGQGRVELFNADGMWNTAFDLILMNILPDVIANSAPAIARCLAASGKFIVSGIIQGGEAYVRQALAAAGLVVTQRLVSKDWIALIGGKARS